MGWNDGFNITLHKAPLLLNILAIHGIPLTHTRNWVQIAAERMHDIFFLTQNFFFSRSYPRPAANILRLHTKSHPKREKKGESRSPRTDWGGGSMIKVAFCLGSPHRTKIRRLATISPGAACSSRRNLGSTDTYTRKGYRTWWWYNAGMRRCIVPFIPNFSNLVQGIIGFFFCLSRENAVHFVIWGSLLASMQHKVRRAPL